MPIWTAIRFLQYSSLSGHAFCKTGGLEQLLLPQAAACHGTAAVRPMASVTRPARPSRPDQLPSGLGVESADAMQGYEGWSEHLHEVVRASEEVDDALGVALPDGIVLYGLVRALRPEFVVETGIATGVSTSFISAALIENGAGRLYSIDLPSEEAANRVYPDGRGLQHSALVGPYRATSAPPWATDTRSSLRM